MATDPRMHTAEHLLNQAMVSLVGTRRCFSAHINPKKSKCDYHFDRDLSPTEVEELERRVNQAISRQLDVTESFMDPEQAERDFDLSRLPEGQSQVRVISVGDVDACPCIGPHVANTRELGTFKIISHDHNDGVLRLRFKLV